MNDDSAAIKTVLVQPRTRLCIGCMTNAMRIDVKEGHGMLSPQPSFLHGSTELDDGIDAATILEALVGSFRGVTSITEQHSCSEVDGMQGIGLFAMRMIRLLSKASSYIIQFECLHRINNAGDLDASASAGGDGGGGR